MSVRPAHLVLSFSFVLCTLATGRLLAAAPEASTLFPAGGQMGQSVTVALGGNVKPWPVQVWSDDEHLTVEADKKEGQVAVTIGADARPGLHWLRFYNADGASPPRPFVVGTLPELSEQEPNNDLPRAQKLSAANLTVNGRLNPAGDLDTFAVELAAGQNLVADVDGEQPLGSPMDTVLQIVDPTGFVLAQNNDDVGLDPRIVYTAARGGPHYVRLFGYSSTPSTSLSLAGGDAFIYRLTLATDGLVDYAFPLSIERGAERSVALCGWGIGDELRSVKFSGSLLERAGPAGVLAAAHPRVGGAALVRVVDLPVLIEQEPNDRDRPQAVTLPVAISGRMDAPGDIDCFAFDAKRGQRLLIKAEARSLGFITDPVVMILNSEGAVLQTFDDSGQQRDPDAAFNIPADGRYRVAIRDLYRGGSPRHVYQLALRIDEPDFSLSLAAGEYTLAQGKTVEIPLTIDRRAGFAEEIAFEIRGLPEGVKLEAPVSQSKGDSAKGVKLKLSGGASLGGAPLEIVGRSTGDKKAERTAGRPLANWPAPWTQVWLTVGK